MNELETVKDLVSFVHDSDQDNDKLWDEHSQLCETVGDIVQQALYYESSWTKQTDFYYTVWRDWYDREHPQSFESDEEARRFKRGLNTKWYESKDYALEFNGVDLLELAVQKGYLIDMDHLPFATHNPKIVDTINMNRCFGYMPVYQYTVEKRKADLCRFLEIAFHQDDQICYEVQYYVWEDGAEEGTLKTHQSSIPVGELMTSIAHSDSVDNVLRGSQSNCNYRCSPFTSVAQVQVNPSYQDEQGEQHIREYRYVVVESSSLGNYQQYELLKDLEVPIVALIASTSKIGLQALVRVDAKDLEEYKQRVKFVYTTLERVGFPVNHYKRHPNATIQIPGTIHVRTTCRLLATHMGYDSYEEWAMNMRMVGTGMGRMKKATECAKNKPERAKVLVDQVLRGKGKMMLTGPSKSYKTFILLDLGVAVTTGQTWLHYQCSKSKVLYINFELTEEEFYDRLNGILQARQLQPEDIADFDVWHNLDDPRPMDELADILIERALDEGYEMIIIDPVYCVMDGDENNASAVKNLFNAFSRLIREFNTAVVYCHHHNKSSKQQTDITERASGSSMFGRFPTAIVDVEVIETQRRWNDLMEAGRNPDESKGLKVQFCTRAFTLNETKYCWFDHFQFVNDATGILEEICSGKKRKDSKGSKESDTSKEHTKTSTADKNKQQVEMMVYADYQAGKNGTHIEKISGAIHKCKETVKNYAEASPHLMYKKHHVYWVEEAEVETDVTEDWASETYETEGKKAQEAQEAQEA